MAESAPAHPAAAAPTLLDALARAPAAAALVVGALDQQEDRKALRLAHPQLSDAVGEATTKLEIITPGAARPPTARRWPRLEELKVFGLDLAALEALGAETWAGLHTLRLCDSRSRRALDAPAARALAAALRRMPALRELWLWNAALSGEAAAELFGAKGAAPQLRSLSLKKAALTPSTAGALAATSWRLEELGLFHNPELGAAGLAALLAAPTFALRRLNLGACDLDAAALFALANAPWPLEVLDLGGNDFSAAAAGPALVALSRLPRLRALNVGYCSLSAPNFKALVEAAWPALTSLNASKAEMEFDGPHALGAAAFAGFSALEELFLSWVELGEAGVRLLASRRWPRLRGLSLGQARLGNAGVAALARGAWPALTWLVLDGSGLDAPPTLEAPRRWAPALEELHVVED